MNLPDEKVFLSPHEDPWNSIFFVVLVFFYMSKSIWVSEVGNQMHAEFAPGRPTHNVGPTGSEFSMHSKYFLIPQNDQTYRKKTAKK